MQPTKDVFSALASSTRLELLEQLRNRRLECTDPENCDLTERCCNVSELAEDLGLTQPTVSHHLKELRRAGLITTVKDGRTLYCEIHDSTFENLSDFMKSFTETEEGSC
ncbi:MAG: ArsR/SmtB family transcription factor [bacterium]